MTNDDHPDIDELMHCLDREDAGEAAAHLRTCAHCQETVATMRALTEALAPADMPAPAWTADEDAAMASFIADRAAELRPPRRGILRFRRVAMAAAAALVVGIGLAAWRAQLEPYFGPVPSIPPPAPTTVSLDMDGDRGIDIVDAYLYARQLKDTGTIGDFNGDGKHDERDVDTVAQMAVHVPRSGGDY